MKEILSIEGLRKEFGTASILQGICLSINEGEIFGLLGLNGAGKTTLLRCLLGLLNFSQGKILFKKNPITQEDIHRYFGYLPEDFQPPLNLSAVELLDLLGRTLNKPAPAEECLKQVGLLKEKDKKIRDYSRGMIQRLGLSLTLLKDPEVIVLDEPILGLDLIGQRQAFEILKGLNSKGKTIIFSSHLLSHIEKYCSRVGIIHGGVLRFTGKITELLGKHNTSSLEEAYLNEVRQ
ncbi:MAG: ABC transporter ATP-binding protein [Candidatus Omnitrophica bacterium]|nr:ABC transporter ATP-binding protein [Candidatus Omnitrophota bacterium]MDD5655197.1 ABC transporter ATP-binding protein [Candidatus Omnitrophota bacterium]